MLEEDTRECITFGNTEFIELPEESPGGIDRALIKEPSKLVVTPYYNLSKE